MYLLEGLKNDFGAGNPGKEMGMSPYRHFEKQLEHKAVHMSGREIGHNVGGVVQLRLSHIRRHTYWHKETCKAALRPC